MKSKEKTPGKGRAYSVVGFLGEVNPPLSYLVPVLHSSKTGETFTLGEGPDASVSEDGIEELISSGHLFRISNPCPLEQVISSMDPEVVVASQRPFSIPCYGFFVDTSAPELSSLRRLDVLDFSDVQSVKDTIGNEIWILSCSALLMRLRKLFPVVERDLDNALVEELIQRSEREDLVERSEYLWSTASLLLDLAYDYRSSERAITYGALLRSLDLERDTRWHFWTRVACKAWGVEDDRAHWLECIGAKLDALAVRARRRQLEATLTGPNMRDSDFALQFLNRQHPQQVIEDWSSWTIESNSHQVSTPARVSGAPTDYKSVVQAVGKSISKKGESHGGIHASK